MTHSTDPQLDELESALANEIRRLRLPVRPDAASRTWQSIERRSGYEAGDMSFAREHSRPRHRTIPALAQSHRRNLRALWAVVGGCLAVAFGLWHSIARTKGPVLYTTAVGQRGSLTLTDGSRVVLAPGSHIRILPTFGEHSRAVELSGEGYFDVVSAAGAPFIVRAGSVTTRVLGTRFDVRHYQTDSVVHVAVVSGRVMTSNSSRQIALASGSAGEFTDSMVSIRADSNQAEEFTDWMRGRLRFNDTPVATVLATLGRWYGYDFRLADSTLAHVMIRAEFPPNASTSTMRLLERVLDVTMTFDGNTVTLRPRHGAAPSLGHRRDSLIVHVHSEVGK